MAIEQRNTMRSRLDLREWWERCDDAIEAQDRMLRWEKWPFYRYNDNESREYIITLKDWVYMPYKLSETTLLLPLESDAIRWKAKGEIALNNLKRYKYKVKLDVRNRVKNAAEAREKAEAWEHKKFWFLSEDKVTLAILDFSKWIDKPRMEEYPFKETKIEYYTIELRK